MNVRSVRVLFRKEMLDLLRDRRTLISLVIAPMVIGPAMMTGMNYYVQRNADEARVQRFKVVLDDRIAIPGLREGLTAAGLDVSAERVPPRKAVETKAASFGVDVSGSPERPAVTIYADNSDLKASMGRRRIEQVLDKLARARVQTALAQRGVPISVLEPFVRKSVNTAKPQQMSGQFVGRLVSFFLLIFLFNGAMYAAVDATAGEKERKTLEVLLASNAGRSEIVTSKMLAAMCTSFATTALSMASYAIAFSSMDRGGNNPMTGMVFASDPLTLLLVAMLILPMAVLAASIAIAGATPARSTREAMSYLTPGIFVVMGLGMVPMLAADGSTWLTIVPFANFAQTLREVLSGDRNWLHYGLTLLSNAVFSAGATALAVRAFNDETILFRS